MNESDPHPLISVITVCFNASSTIVSTMRSVGEQTAVDFEHIIMDGASKDDTLLLVEKHKTGRTRVFSSPDKGIYDAMNKALKEAKGKYVLFLNSGDRFAHKDIIARYEQAIRGNDCPGIVYGQTVLIDDSGTIIGERHLRAPEKLTYKSFSAGMLVCHQAFMVRKDIAPLYNLSYRFSADYDWCLECLKKSDRNVYLGDTPVIKYLSEGLTTRNHKASLKERFKIMSRHYGFIPTAMRHLRFALRYWKRRSKAINNQ